MGWLGGGWWWSLMHGCGEERGRIAIARMRISKTSPFSVSHSGQNRERHLQEAGDSLV